MGTWKVEGSGCLSFQTSVFYIRSRGLISRRHNSDSWAGTYDFQVGWLSHLHFYCEETGRRTQRGTRVFTAARDHTESVRERARKWARLSEQTIFLFYFFPPAFLLFPRAAPAFECDFSFTVAVSYERKQPLYSEEGHPVFPPTSLLVFFLYLI